ncbi:MAG: hypothetical protein IJB96_04950 [Lachnospira sp.]|nr:hypothetical protein [Lachnospira sp.]
MKFQKTMYKAAMDKIDNPEKRKAVQYNINQKYKSEILSGKINDQWAGWDASNIVYDDEMLKKEYDKKMIICLPFIAIGIALAVAVGLLVYDNTRLKVGGSECKAYYGYSEDLNRYAYIFRWKSEDDERTSMQISEEKKMLKNGILVTGNLNDSGQNINIYAIYSSKHELFDDRGKVGAPETILAAKEAGVHLVDMFIYVDEYNTISFDSMEKEEEYFIPLYYMPQEGEDIFDLRGVYKTDYVVTLCVIVLIYNVIWIGRLIWLGKKQREYN